MTDPLWISLSESFGSYIKRESDIKLIEKAYFLAKEKHDGQMRKSGDAYITHPVAVAKIIADLHGGPATIIAALLHDTVEDTSLSLKEVAQHFGQDISQLVDGVTKLSKLSFNESVSQADNHQKMLLAMAKDIRVILIKIADRLHNIRTLESMTPEKQYKIATETLEIYAPLAHRLGIFRIKAELEDRSLRYTDPPMYYRVSNMIQAKKSEREASIDQVISNIKILFDQSDLHDFEIKGRIKNIYSIYKKMVKDNKQFEDIYDLLAVRIIVDKIETCYQALGIIHANFTPIPRRFKDYIAVPKPNMYQSLHTTVLSDDGTLFEVQIRTPEMDQIAEYGIAAHWAYKENKTYSREKEQFEIAQKLKWYGELLKMSQDTDETSGGAEEFVGTIKGDILDANVYVFTPKGEVIELPKGATPIDFAYRIHTDVGNKMVGAIVNNRIVTIDYELNTGDIVSVKTSKASQGPSEDWLKIAKSQHARHKIKSFLNKLNKDSLIQMGKDALDREFVAHKVTEPLEDAFVKKHFEKNMIQTIPELYLEIGKGNLSPKTVVNKLLGIETDPQMLLQRQMEKAARQLTTHSETGVVIEGLSSPQLKLANCCLPIPGDPIIGYVSKQSGIVIHASFCPNCKQFEENRLIEAYWSSDITRKYPTWIKLVGTNKPSLLADVITTVNASSIAIAEVNAMTTTSFEIIIKLKVSILNSSQLQTLMANLRKISDIYSVERDFK
ncbi:MAG: bifunctional (p)ppGpp synthetase/guanosine-3',5'-bis(diphosphate) 3'-pyrophosphohydrolase [Acholeplasmataceae bacterium]|jgi:GTP pyrophosphokinase|nr:bifunctional (p)ppGpp synthetase/guanosine-3',5'-bis(diphosphate) 3'-pyrophosphohydrolase [Acholeplasmataceae bacterium]